MKTRLIVAGLAFSIGAFGHNIVDLYGDNSATARIILKKYTPQVVEVEESLQKLALEPNPEQNPMFDKIVLKRRALAEKIKNEGDYLNVHFNTVFYPDKKNQYTTIEVVTKNHAERMRYRNRIADDKKYPVKDDLINQMMTFTNIEFNLMYQHKLDSNPKHRVCPFYHCVSGYSAPQLKPYLEVFKVGVVKERKLILDTLNNDPDPERRAAAIYLVGCFSDPQEIVQILSQHINDPSSLVRNNALRVLGATIQTAKMTEIDVTPFLGLLNSPDETDRNKTLWVLLTVSKSKKAKPILIQKAGENLIQLLALKQPNNHEMAYMVLKEISGKDFGEHNVKAWEQWLSSIQKNMA